MDRVIEKALKIAQGKIKPIRFHQTIAQRGYSDGGAALTTGEPMSAPERPQTLALQMQQLANGKRAAVFVAKGSRLGNIPEDMEVINTREGDIYFNPELISEEEVTEAATSGRLNELLDYVQSKPEALEKSLEQGETPRVVVSRDADGIEQDAAAVSPDRVEEQAEIFADRAKGGSTISEEDLNSPVVRDRLAEGGVPDEESQEKFLKEQLEGSAPQYDPEGGWKTAKEAGRMAATMTTPGAIADAAGMLGAPSIKENIGKGKYLDAALQAAGTIPVVGPLAKGAGAAHLAMSLAPKARVVEDALRLAREAKPVEKAAEKLEKASRLARAKELGFDVSSPYYHATQYDFNEFVPSKWRGATYFADTPEGAMRGRGAGASEHPALGGPAGPGESAGPNIMPVYLKGKIWGKDPMPEEWFPKKITYGEWKDIVDGKNKLNIEDLSPEELEVLNWKRSVGFNTSYENGRQFDTYVPDLSEEEYKNFPIEREREMPLIRARVPIPESHGWQGLEGPEGKKYRDFYNKVGYPNWIVNDEAGRSVAVSNPQNIRSIFSQFDPQMSEGTDIRYKNGGKTG